MNAHQNSILKMASKLVSSDGQRDDVLTAVCFLISEEFGHYNWVGIYIAEPKRKLLHLGPYAGERTEHVKIPYGKGVCGQVAADPRTLVVPEVSKEENYLACSTKVRSEIVVPIMKAGKFVAQLDIDSHKKNAFSDEDKEFLEGLCRELAKLF